MCAVEVDGVRFIWIADLAEELGVTRQTLWRWRNSGKIPLGHRFRDRRVLFTASEAEEIRRFANHIEPIEHETTNQMRLFG